MADSIISNISSLSSPNLIGAAKTQLAGKKDLVKQAVVSKTDELKGKVTLLTNKIKQTENEYSDKTKKLQSDFQLGYINEEEVTTKYNQFQIQLTSEIQLIQESIQKLQQDIQNQSTDILKKAKEAKKKINNNINSNIKKSKAGLKKANLSRNVTVLKNPFPLKDKIAPIILNLLTNLAIYIINKNGKLQELVDKTNEIIDAADTPEKINQARVLRNNALNIINTQEAKIIRIKNIINTIQRIIEVLITIITIIQIILKLGSPIPIPLPVKTKLQPILQKILKILSELIICISIINSILGDIIIYLEDLKAQLHNLGELINAKLANPNLDVEQFLQNLQSNTNNQLNDINNTIYKGFKFAIREESGPNAIVVRGYKRKYAVAIDTNNVEVLKSDLSFTQDPQDLIDTLKIIIDRENLIA